MNELDKLKEENESFMDNYRYLQKIPFDVLKKVHKKIWSFNYKGIEKNKICYKLARHYNINSTSPKEDIK